MYQVPNLAGVTSGIGFGFNGSVRASLPHLQDGVNDGAYRYVGVRRGTIIVSGDKLVPPKWTPLPAPLLRIPPNSDLRIAGTDRVFHMSASYDSLPAGGPKLRGIGVDGGAIW